MPILSLPPLPVERFEEFKRFARTLAPAGWANATGVALSVEHMLGIAIIGPDAEEEALQQWAADFGTERWREASERAQRAAEQPLPYAFSFGFGLPLPNAFAARPSPTASPAPCGSCRVTSSGR